MTDYKKTLNLPETSFPMKANLTQREPEMLKYWEKINAYGAMVASGNHKGTFVLHDGPPYANGYLHMGHALNKVIKDIIIKSRNMQGYQAEYVPGWDCHGLPIELKVEQELGEKKAQVPPTTVRRLCREYATKWINIQRDSFKRMGVFGVWNNPYISMDPAYEAATARELGNFMGTDSLTRSKKPIHWCASCHTALAEAEVEYKDSVSPSIFVRFAINDPKLTSILPKAVTGHTYAVIWTTTPWTLPSNRAIAVHPDFEYALVSTGDDYYVIAKELLESCQKQLHWDTVTVLETVKGNQLEGLVATHPFTGNDSPIVLANYVTLDAGTGLVHTAPGHGREDYDTAMRYGLEVASPIDDNGHFFFTEPLVGGKNLTEANAIIIEQLKSTGDLLANSKITHSYPHCWRCKKPVFFRATTQWFISMEKNNLRARALDAIRNKLQWIPSWGEERIYAMIENRPDWCISRQRAWGVPITALLCEGCGEPWYSAEWNAEIAEKFASHPTGCDYWFDAPLEDIVPAGLTCKSCGSTHWKRETDILDVWFDSGTSFAAVLEQRKECRFPADLYLEGSDQHRGWFHSSLLASMGTRGIPPYKAVLTHGYVVDGEGKKMSKSVGNIIEPNEVINKHGAEILRMWAASVDYREDIRLSDEILNRQIDAYRRIRNTCRYLLGNLKDFNAEDALPINKLDPLDKYALDVVSRAHQEVQQAYASYEFHKVFHTLHNLCATDLSSFYLDILKDRLYASGKNSEERRSAQTALWHILLFLISDMAPVLSFTAEEVFTHLPETLRPGITTVFAMPAGSLPTFLLDDTTHQQWKELLAIRTEVTKAIEPIRQAGTIGHSLDTALTLYADAGRTALLEELKTDLRAVFLVSQFSIQPLEQAPDTAVQSKDIPGIAVGINKADGEKCARCWIYSTELGIDPNYPATCPRCTEVLKKELA